MIASKGTRLHTFDDGSELHISTTYFEDENFACELYVSPARGGVRGLELRRLPETIVAKTCRGAQDLAYARVQALYPKAAGRITAPPYLICCGPNGYAERVRPRWHQRQKPKLESVDSRGHSDTGSRRSKPGR